MNKAILYLLFFLPVFLHSQLSTVGGIAPSQLVQNTLVGQGVTVSNVQYIGASGAIGRFNGANTSVGLDQGIILTTGTINSGPDGPYGPNQKPNAGIDNGAGGYALLTNLVGTNTYNAAVLSFDFVPQSDTVKFRYVFGSEEYPEWVGDQFNDVFAFFISGPGIPGGQQNMALIPGTFQPVAINNVNNGTNNTGPCTNCMFYKNNGTGNNAPFNQNPFYVEYDGLTVPLEAVSPVQCGETYRLIIAIADVGDAIYDSGIFLEANSLTSEQPVTVDYQLSDDPYNDGQTMAQGCTSTTVTITRSGNNLDQPLTVPINLSGTALQGVDFSSVPSEVTFAPFQTEITFSFDALVNPGVLGTLSVILEFEIQDPCGNDSFQYVEVFINPVDDVEVTIANNEVLCPGDEVELIAIASGGGSGYTYLWNTGETTSSIFVSPQSTETFTVTVTDGCLEQTVSASGTVNVPNYDDLTIFPTPDFDDDCPYVPFDLAVEANGGAGGYSYLWTTENGTTISNSPVVNVVPSQTTTYYITVTDQCGEETSDSVTITILSPPLLITVTPEQEICPGDSAVLEVTATGGFGSYYYFWPTTGETTSQITVNPLQTTAYEVEVMDDCQSFKVVDETKVIVVQPEANFTIVTDPIFNGLPITFQNLTNNGNYYQWFFGDGGFSTQVHPNNTYEFPGEYLVTLIAEDLKGCTDTITKPIRIREEHFIYIPNAFTPDGDRFNNFFEASTINIRSLSILVFNRWGEVVYSSESVDFKWDGSYNGTKVRDGVYVWKIEYETNEGEAFEINGHVTVLR
jgi:gliding motility-associated-like protein